MSTATELDDTGRARRILGCGCRIVRQADLTYGICKGHQVVGARLRLLLYGESDNLPSTRRRQGLRVRKAEVVAVWFRLGCQRTEHRC